MRDPVSDIHVRHTCPHLGLAGDPGSHCLFISRSHRCFRWPEPRPIDENHQTAFCLSPEYRDCFRLVSPEDPSDLLGVHRAQHASHQKKALAWTAGAVTMLVVAAAAVAFSMAGNAVVLLQILNTR